MKKENRKKHLILIILLLAAALYAFLWQQNSSLVTTEYTVQADVPAAFDGTRIVQISDLHNKRFGKGQHRLVEEIKAAQPDIIVMTGDMVDMMHGAGEWGCATGCVPGGDYNAAIELVRAAVDIAPVYYVNGNNDHRCRLYGEYIELVQESGAVVLNNASVQLADESGEYINIAGLDNSFVNSGILQQVKEDEGFTLLLAHKPHFADRYCDAGAELVLSGHAHGGQFGSCSGQGMYAPGQGFFPSHTSGCFRLNGRTQMVVSRGLGNSLFPQRLFNRPEVVVVELEKE